MVATRVITIVDVIMLFILGGTSNFAGAAPPNCHDQDATEGVAVSLSELIPTQPNVGLGEVIRKQDDYTQIADPNIPLKDGDEPVPVVVGPGGKLYVSDHHHFVMALLRGSKNSNVKVMVKIARDDKNNLENGFCKKEGCSASNAGCVQDFWKDLAQKHLAYLCNDKDQPISYKNLPTSFSEKADPKLENDPYRTLVNALRKYKTDPNDKKSKCLERPPTTDRTAFFWEFRMAENIRRHLKDTVTIEKLKNSTSNDFDDDILQKTCAAAKETDPPEAPKFVSCAELNSKDTSRVTGSLGSTSSGGKPPSGSEAKE